MTPCILLEIHCISEECTAPSLPRPSHLSDGVSILPQNIGKFVPELLGLHPRRQ